jgi:hypothetical protein
MDSSYLIMRLTDLPYIEVALLLIRRTPNEKPVLTFCEVINRLLNYQLCRTHGDTMYMYKFHRFIANKLYFICIN